MNLIAQQRTTEYRSSKGSKDVGQKHGGKATSIPHDDEEQRMEDHAGADHDKSGATGRMAVDDTSGARSPEHE